MSDLSQIETIEDLIAHTRLYGPAYFFSGPTMRYFRFRVYPEIWHTSDGILFITSEKYTDSLGVSEPRLYTVRLYTVHAHIRDLPEFQAFKSLGTAQTYARRYAKEHQP